MSDISKTIGWVHRSWNPFSGCDWGCRYCYARVKSQNPRYRGAFPLGFKPTFYPNRLDAKNSTSPLFYKRPKTFFIGDLGDLFGDYDYGWYDHLNPDYDFEVDRVSVYARIIETIEKCPQHFFFVLTKQMIPDYAKNRKPENLWFGLTLTVETSPDAKITIREYDFYSLEPFVFDPFTKPLNLPKYNIKWVVIGSMNHPYCKPNMRRLQSCIESCDQLEIPIFIKDPLLKKEFRGDKAVCQFPPELQKFWKKD